jgi:hypothetical protein
MPIDTLATKQGLEFDLEGLEVDVIEVLPHPVGSLEALSMGHGMTETGASIPTPLPGPLSCCCCG